MYNLLIALLIFFLATPSWAFVERLGPNVHGTSTTGIPCHAMGAILRNFVAPGGPSAATLGNIIQREWVPGGWSAQDTTDNSALISALGALTQPNKEAYVQRVEDYCILWELGVDELDSPEEYRIRLGIAP